MKTPKHSLLVYSCGGHEDTDEMVYTLHGNGSNFPQVESKVGVPPFSVMVDVSFHARDQGCGPILPGYWHGGVDKKGVHHVGILCSVEKARKITWDEWIDFTANAIRLVLADIAGTRSPEKIKIDPRDPYTVLLQTMGPSKGSRKTYKEPVFIEKHRREVVVVIPTARWTRATKAARETFQALMENCHEGIRGAMLEDQGVSQNAAEWTFTCTPKGLKTLLANVRQCFEGSPLRKGADVRWRVAYSGTKGRKVLV